MTIQTQKNIEVNTILNCKHGTHDNIFIYKIFKMCINETQRFECECKSSGIKL